MLSVVGLHMQCTTHLQTFGFYKISPLWGGNPYGNFMYIFCKHSAKQQQSQAEIILSEWDGS